MDEADRQEIIRRLQTRFPDQQLEQIEAAVRTAIDRLAGRPIQDFTPVLVEKAAVEQLRTPGT